MSTTPSSTPSSSSGVRVGHGVSGTFSLDGETFEVDGNIDAERANLAAAAIPRRAARLAGEETAC